MTSNTAPRYRPRYSCNHCTDSASKWLVGSSISSKSGSASNAVARAIRLRYPPERWAILASKSTIPNLERMILAWVSSSQASVAAICSVTRPNLAINRSNSSPSTWAMRWESSSYSRTRVMRSPLSAKTCSRTVRLSSSSGCWGK